jgi:hypothetical protein
VLIVQLDWDLKVITGIESSLYLAIEHRFWPVGDRDVTVIDMPLKLCVVVEMAVTEPLNLGVMFFM